MTVRARDDPGESILFGIFGEFSTTAKKVMEGEWRDATWAEDAKFPLENLYVMKKKVLRKELGYKIDELATLLNCTVPFGELSGIEVLPWRLR